MKLDFKQEGKLFEAGEKTAYLLHGEYEFLQKELASKIVRHLLPEDEIENSLLRFDASEDKSLDAVADTASVPSLFGDTQVLLVDEAQNWTLKKNEANSGKRNLTPHQKFHNYRAFEKLEEAISNPSGTARMIFICQGALRPPGKTGKSTSEKIIQRLFGAIDEHGVVVSFPRMYDDDLFSWLMGRASAMDVSLAPRQVEMFMEWTGKDVRHMVNELAKLASMFPNGEKIPDQELRRLVTSSEDFFVNYLVDFMLERRSKAALRMLDHSLERGQHPVLIISMIAARLRLVWQARYLMDNGHFQNIPRSYGGAAKGAMMREISAVKPGVAAALAHDKKDSILSKTPFALYNIVARAKDFSLPEIEAAISLTADADRKLKGIVRPKRGTDEIMIQCLIVDIASGATLAASPS